MSLDYVYKAKVVSVYDADTITLDIEKTIDIGFNTELTWKWKNRKCRLFGIDAPEMRGEERLKGILARDALRALILGKYITIKTYKDKSGKYGRILVDSYTALADTLVEVYSYDDLNNKININEWLVENHYAVSREY